MSARNTRLPDPALWGLERCDQTLHMDGVCLTTLARAHGTPLHVVSARQLRRRCGELKDAFAGFPTPVHLCFSYKTNPVAGVLRQLHAEGIGAEVVDGYELWLANRLGVQPDDIVFNGPNKRDDELRDAIGLGIGLLVVDSYAELERVREISGALQRTARVALRICPDVVPRGMNVTSLTGSRRNHFGMELRSSELEASIRVAARASGLRLRGMHAHIGSGIRTTDAFEAAADRILGAQAAAVAAGADPDLIDLGGGLGTRFSREFTTWELLTYLAFGRMPKTTPVEAPDWFARYGQALRRAIEKSCQAHRLRMPSLVLEPGRALASDAQVLLLTVGRTRQRPGVGRFAIADGGAMTVSLMFLSELHQVMLCNRDAPLNGTTSVFGRLPSPMDVIYRNLPLPELLPGDVLAIMDAGAYFTATSTNFGGPRPAVVMVDAGRSDVIRRRETFEDLARLDSGLEGEQDRSVVIASRRGGV